MGNIYRFEFRTDISAAGAQSIPHETAGAEYLSEPVGDEEAAAATQRVFLPLVAQAR